MRSNHPTCGPSQWPHSRTGLTETLAKLPDDEGHRIAERNACELTSRSLHASVGPATRGSPRERISRHSERICEPDLRSPSRESDNQGGNHRQHENDVTRDDGGDEVGREAIVLAT